MSLAARAQNRPGTEKRGASPFESGLNDTIGEQGRLKEAVSVPRHFTALP